MKYDHFSARCLFVDGPVAVYLSEAPSDKILEAYHRLGRLVEVAARQLDPPQTSPSFVNCSVVTSLLGDRTAAEFP